MHIRVFSGYSDKEKNGSYKINSQISTIGTFRNIQPRHNDLEPKFVIEISRSVNQMRMFRLVLKTYKSVDLEKTVLVHIC